MAVMMIMVWDDVTLDQYEQTRQLVNWEGDVPPGGMFHVAAHDGKSLRITDVWETAEQFQEFVNTRLMPGVLQIGLGGEPRVEVYPAYAVFAPAYTSG